MHDTILLHRIAEQVNQLCISNNIKKINKLAVTVNHKSHVNENNLLDHLKNSHNNLVGVWTEIKVNREDMQDQTAILNTIEGEKNE